MNSRVTELQNWLQTLPELETVRLQMLAHDASFRRYFRVATDNQTYVAMDAPPEKEKCDTFINVSQLLLSKNIQVPRVKASNLKQGFLLLSDFGDAVLLKILNSQNALRFYQEALQNLVSMQKIDATSLPVFDSDFILQELLLFQDWFLQRFLQLELTTSQEKMLEKYFYQITEKVSQQPYTFMHRDYHSANLMVLHDNSLGILDFQDAMYGPITYDLVSLLKDCYIDWPPNFVSELFFEFKLKQATLKSMTNDNFLNILNNTALQRHLKALLTFSRKFKRDNNAGYLQFIPRTLKYILDESQHLGYDSLNEFFVETVKPKLHEVLQCAR